MEAKYVACFAAIQDVVWLKGFLQHLEIVKTTFKHVTIFCDNTVALVVAKDLEYHRKTKHIKKRYHYIRDAIIEDVVLKHISTSNLVADPLTKPIARDIYVGHVRSLGLCKM